MDENYFRPSKDQLNKIVPKIKTDNSEVISQLLKKIDDLELEIKRLNQIIIEMELSDNE